MHGLLKKSWNLRQPGGRLDKRNLKTEIFREQGQILKAKEKRYSSF